MLADVAGQPLQLQRHIPDFLGIAIFCQELPQDLLPVAGFLQGDAHLERNELRELVRQAVGFTLNARDVPHHRLRRHGAEDHPVAAGHAEIHVEVGHGYPFGIEKALEKQVVGDGVQVCNLQRVGHQRPSAGTASRSHRDTLLFRPANEVHHDQKITRKYSSMLNPAGTG